MIAAGLLTLAIVTQDSASLRAAPRDSAPQQAALAQGDTLEIRGERLDYLQVYDHRRERAGFIHKSQIRGLGLQPADAPELLSVVRFLRDSPGSEALGIGYSAAYLKAAPAPAIGAESFDALGQMAERLARRASRSYGKLTSDQLSAQLESAAFYGVTFKNYQRGDGQLQLCYEGEAFRRVLALPSDAAQRARAALALTRHDCMDADMHPQLRLAHDQWRAGVLDSLSPAQFAELPGIEKNRLRLRRAGVAASLAFQLARRGETPQAAGQRALAELAAVDKAELTESDLQDYNDAAIRVGASRWAAEAAPAAAQTLGKLTLTTTPGQAGETCVALFENGADGRPGKDAVARRCSYGIVWGASASAQANGQALALAVQPLESWAELWVFRKSAGQWQIDVLPPASSAPELGYVEFAGWAPASGQLLLVRETRSAGRYKRNFEVARLDTLTPEKQASDAGMLAAFGKFRDARWKKLTVSLR